MPLLVTEWVGVLEETPLDVMLPEVGVVHVVDVLGVILDVELALVEVDGVMLDEVLVSVMLLDVLLVHVTDVLVVVLDVKLTELEVEEVTVSLVIV